MDGSYELKISLTKDLKRLFKNAMKGETDIPQRIKQCIKCGDYVGVDEIQWLHKNKKDKDSLHDILSNTELVLPEPIVPPRNPELEARCQRLRAEQAEKEYKKMTRNVNSTRSFHPEDSIRYQMNMINRQLIAVFQFVVSVAAGFTFGFYGIQLMTGDLDFGFRLLLGIIFSLVIALAEIYFLAKKLAEEMDYPDLPKAKVD